MKRALIILLVVIYSAAFGQHKINVVLKKQLDSVMVLDQKYRDTLSLLMDPHKADSVAKALSYKPGQAVNHYWALQNRLDSLNVLFIEGVFTQYGYPGKTLVDTPANEAAWYVIQHSKKIDQYLPMMKKAAETGELPFQLYAKMLDRQLMYQGKEQIYGTQGMCRPLKNQTNAACFIWPIKDPENVNKRRKEAGFSQTVEQNAARMGMVYRIVKMDEVK